MSELISSLKKGFFLGLGFIGAVGITYAAISWPSAPAGETTGGKYSLKLVPSTAIMAFNSTTCPVGWSTADGNSGRPDLRGEFIRGLDAGRGVDTGRTLASIQGDAIRNITGKIVTNSANGTST